MGVIGKIIGNNLSLNMINGNRRFSLFNSCMKVINHSGTIFSKKNTNNKTINTPKLKINKIIVAGDSLSDSKGKMLKKTLGILPSSNQYYQGRFTNGYTWVDFLEAPTSLNIPIKNKAEGGAVAGNYSKLSPINWFISSIKKQIKDEKFNKNDLLIIFAGANDYITLNKCNVDKVIQDQEKNILESIEKGANNIIVMDIPDLSITPSARIQGNQVKSKFKELSRKHNRKINELLDKLIKEHPNIKIILFKISEFLKEITDKVNILNKQFEENGQITRYITDKAYSTSGYISYDEDKKIKIDHHYLFNDKVHPSQEIHAIMALEIESMIRKNFIIETK